MELSVDTRPGLVTGKPMVVLARLERGGESVLGGSLKALVDVPSVALGPLLDGPTIAVRPTLVVDDLVTPFERKLELTGALDRLAKGRETITVQMFDDGVHGDGRARDGVYGGVFDATKLPGQYAVRVIASDIPAGGRTVTREATLHRAIGLRLDPAASAVRVERLEPDGPGDAQVATHAVIVTPRAADGAQLGPGHAVAGVLRNERRDVPVQFIDRLDGRYTARIALSEKALAGWRLDITVDGAPFRRLRAPFVSHKAE